jgi:hypothetical protein
MKKHMVVVVIGIVIGTLLVSGCTSDKSNTNQTNDNTQPTVDFAKIHEASDNRIKTNLLNDGNDYHDIEAMTFGDRTVDIVDANHWTVTGEFTIAGVTHSYVSDVAFVNEAYTAMTTII